MLSDQGNYFKALVDSLPDMVWSFDENFNLTAANVAFFESRKSLYHSEIKTGDSFFKDVSDDRIQKWKPLYERVLKGERLLMEDERMFGGRHTFVDISLNPVYNNTGSVIGCMGITYDVTKLHEQDSELNQYKKLVDQIQTRSDFTIIPSISKILTLSVQLDNKSHHDKNDEATILFMLSNELTGLNKELSQILNLLKGPKAPNA